MRAAGCRPVGGSTGSCRPPPPPAPNDTRCCTSTWPTGGGGDGASPVDAQDHRGRSILPTAGARCRPAPRPSHTQTTERSPRRTHHSSLPRRPTPHTLRLPTHNLRPVWRAIDHTHTPSLLTRRACRTRPAAGDGGGRRARSGGCACGQPAQSIHGARGRGEGSGGGAVRVCPSQHLFRHHEDSGGAGGGVGVGEGAGGPPSPPPHQKKQQQRVKRRAGCRQYAMPAHPPTGCVPLPERRPFPSAEALSPRAQAGPPHRPPPPGRPPTLAAPAALHRRGGGGT